MGLKKVHHLKYGTSCFDSRELSGTGRASVGDAHGVEGLGGSACCSSLKSGAGGQLKLELNIKMAALESH